MRTAAVVCLLAFSLPAVAADLTVPAAGTVLLPGRDRSTCRRRSRSPRTRRSSARGRTSRATTRFPRDSARSASSPSRPITLPIPPAGRLEVSTFIVAQRGRSGSDGQSRQEIGAIPSSEYLQERMQFIDVRHKLPTYTNVGIVNLAEAEQTFRVWARRRLGHPRSRGNATDPLGRRLSPRA